MTLLDVWVGLGGSCLFEPSLLLRLTSLEALNASTAGEWVNKLQAPARIAVQIKALGQDPETVFESLHDYPCWFQSSHRSRCL